MVLGMVLCSDLGHHISSGLVGGGASFRLLNWEHSYECEADIVVKEYYEVLVAAEVGVENGPQTSECTSSNGFVMRLTLTQMNFCLCLAWLHMVHIESSFVNLGMRDRTEAGCI